MRVSITFDIDVSVEDVAQENGVEPAEQLGALAETYFLYEYEQVPASLVGANPLDVFEAAVLDCILYGDLGELAQRYGYAAEISGAHTSPSEPTVREIMRSPASEEPIMAFHAEYDPGSGSWIPGKRLPSVFLQALDGTLVPNGAWRDGGLP